ncbi:ATP-binding cassette domain-containing protein [Budviciaceae bacterium BWR-B9]|uniref:ATP-binding cassette domain-containing protein n=1 Tax=Limnobaculum allomyrinae TaxID=2791986 RepID=A0ABS1IUC2_9GAMM|nr:MULTISPECIES: ATP-binding cassette domain-containing protein [Limnobaculum]MBK5145343.1 ATP-binding cassette domain-containing protein [Limnobaculum allomyrinae]MBV7693229.1 ATP-binding cassette domain-containing protein [Limnobaculum sp. M2-1]
MSELFINQLQVRFNGSAQAALNISQLVVPGGAHVAVTGASGSGKTTLVNAISGLERSGSGKIFWDGKDIGRMSERQRDRWRATNVGLVMQDFHLYPGLSALDNVLLPARFHHWRLPSSLKTHAAELLEQVGIRQHRQVVDTLSRGEKQRVAIARALLSKPEIVIADEPTASLDANNGLEVIRLLTQFAKLSKSTLICITHDPRLSDEMRRRITLENGRPVKDITTGRTL